MKAMFTGNGLNNQLKGLDFITCLYGICIFKVDFVLSWCHFVVGSFDFKAHFFQFKNDVASAVFAQVHRCQVKIAAVVIQFKRWFASFIKFEQEEFRLWSKVKMRKS